MDSSEKKQPALRLANSTPLTSENMTNEFSEEPLKRGWITNRNKFFLGALESGKSFLTNHFIPAYFIQGAYAMILAVDNSYEQVCHKFDGIYLTFREEKPISFNPFYIDGRELPNFEKQKSLMTLLATIWKNEGELLTKNDEKALSLAIRGYFLLLQTDDTVEAGFNSFFEYLSNEFIDDLNYYKILINQFKYVDLITNLRPFYKGGQYDYLLNSTTNLDLLEEPFIVFDLDYIKDHPVLFPVVTISIMDTYITKMRKLKGVRKVILLEEAWKTFITPSMASFIRSFFRSLRSHFGEAWLVTQELMDLKGNTIVQEAIVSNTDTKILLDQRNYEHNFSLVQNILGITEKQKNLILSLNRDLRPGHPYKEFSVIFGNERNGQELFIYGLEVSQEEGLCYTTEQSVKREVHKLVALNGGNWEAGIQSYVELGKRRSKFI